MSLGIDLTFAVLTTFAYLVFLGVSDVEARHQVLIVIGTVYVGKTVLWMLVFRAMLQPIEAWRRQRKDDGDLREVIRRAGVAIYNVPLLLGTAWALLWGLFFVVVSAVLAVWHPFAVPRTLVPATLLFAMGPGCGSMAVIVPMLTYFMAPLAGRISLHARQAGVTIKAIHFPFANRMAVLTFCLSLAPTCWMAGMAYMMETRHGAAPSEEFMGTVAIFCLVVLVFAAVVAWFLVGTVAGPVARIAGAMREVSDPSNVARLPIPQQDEIGFLAAGVNDMFDRLGASAVEIRQQATDLERQNHALIEAARMKSQFLANMSHELRTPLNAIIGFSRIVSRKAQGKLDETQLNNLRLIHQSGQQLLTLVNDMLDFERIEAGRLQVTMAPLDAADVAEQVHATLLPLAEKKGLTLDLALTRRPLPIVSDADRLRQILINLVNNAIKYSDTGRIVLSLEPRSSHLYVEVSDQGIGIPAEHLQRIFDPFYQVDPSSTREREGAGLGLAIVHKLAHLLGGSLTVKSQANVGSTFTLELPMPAERPPAEGPREGQVVLIIDDEINDRQILQTELAEMGFRVETAASGREGLQRAQELKPAAIVLDLIMPEMPGLEVLKALRELPDTARIPVVVATVQDKVQHGFDPGITAWLTKPIETEELRTNLRRAMQGIRTEDVLVVEDDAATRELIEQELGALSYRVRTVADGAAALSAIQDRLPQAVILDLMLPGMDGFELLQQLRGQVPVVIYTGRDLSSAEQERLSAGFVSVVRKHGERGVQGVLESLSRVLS